MTSGVCEDVGRDGSHPGPFFTPRKAPVIQLAKVEVDYDLRRREIARVVARLWATRGERACTMRAVAAELGTSMTVITRSFATRAELMRFTRELVVSDWMEIAAKAIAAQSTPARKLRALLLQQCPIDEQTLADADLWLQTLAPQHRDEALVAANTRYAEWVRTETEPLLEALGIDRGIAPLLVVACYGLNAAAVEDPQTWTYDHVERALDEILCRFGIEDDDSGRAHVSPGHD